MLETVFYNLLIPRNKITKPSNGLKLKSDKQTVHRPKKSCKEIDLKKEDLVLANNMHKGNKLSTNWLKRHLKL